MSPPQPSSLRTEHLHSLLARWQQGERQAADELIRRVGHRLECLARGMLRCYPTVRAREQTADVLQEASLRLLKALREVTPENTKHFFNLASQQIRFHLLDLARRYRQGAPQPLHEHAEPVATGTGTAEVEELERWQALHEAVGELPKEQGEVFGFRFYQGWTWPEIAGLLQVNEKTARRHWNRACIALRKALGGWMPPDEEVPTANPQA
jgi:RNA polymerase sigma factor (sigma-70 family)